MATLRANPNLILVKRGETSGTTQISYEKRASERIWHRIGPTPTTKWELKDFSALPADQEREAETKFSYPSPEVPPGRIYQVRVMDPGADPNRTLPEGVQAAVNVRSLLEEPLNQNLITDENGPEIGGTFVWHKIYTQEPTFKQLIVGGIAPLKQANGMLSFQDVIGSTPVPSELTQDEELEVTGLLPGNPYFAIVLITDRLGNWQILDYPFTTLQREVTISSINWRSPMMAIPLRVHALNSNGESTHQRLVTGPTARLGRSGLSRSKGISRRATRWI